MGLRGRIDAKVVTTLALIGAAIGLATAIGPQFSANASPKPPIPQSIAASANAASGVTILAANGEQTNARIIAKGIAARALAANAFLVSGSASGGAGHGMPCPYGDQENASRSECNGNAALLVTSAASPNRVSQIAAGIFSAFAGTGVAGSLGDGGAATAAQFSLKTDSPIERSGIAIAADGTIFIADTGNSTIRRVASNSAAASTEPGIVRSVAGRFGPAQNVSLVEPLGLAIDRLGNLYIADRGANAVFQLAAATGETPGALSILAHVASPANIAVTQDGSKVFVASDATGAIFSIDTASRNVSTVAKFSGRPDACMATSAGSSAAAAANAAVCPAALATDPRGNLYVSDANGNQLLRVGAADSKVASVAANFKTPGAIASDVDGNLYVADQSRAAIVFVPADGAQCITGPSGTLQICPASNDFGSVVQGGTTSTVPFVLTNTTGGDIPALTYSPALPSPNPPVQPPTSPYIVQTTSCITSIAANSSCTLNVTFSPSATGATTGTLSVSDSTPADTVNSSLTGTGTNYQLQLATNQGQSVTVIAGETAVYNFTLIPDATNPYTGPVTIVCPPSYNPNNPTSTTNLPLLAYCVPPSSPVMLTAGQNTNFKVSIETTSRAGVTSTAQLLPAWFGEGGRGGQNGIRRAGLFTALVLLLFAAVFILVGRAPLARYRVARAALALLAIAAMGAAFSACGGQKLVVDGTPAGTTTLLVQATAQGTGRSFTVQLIVQ